MFSGPQDSSASLPFSRAAVCADGPVAANSDGALVAAVLGRGRKEALLAGCGDGKGREVFTGVWRLLKEGAWRLCI